MKLPKCKYSVSGSHLWEIRTWKNNDIENGVFWNIKIPRCVLCNLHDDRKVRLPKNKKLTYKYEKP